MTKAFVRYNGENIEVKVDSVFQGAGNRMANVTAVHGFPFLSSDVNAQGKTSGSWNCNGLRVRIDFVIVTPDTSKIDAEIDVLKARRDSILGAFKDEPLTTEQACALISELAEIETELQPFVDPTGDGWFDFEKIDEIEM